MSINLGNEAIQAAGELRSSPQWAAIRTALHARMVEKMNAALDSAPEHRADAVGYTRALRDLVVAFDAATLGVQHQRIAKVGPTRQTAPASA